MRKLLLSTSIGFLLFCTSVSGQVQEQVNTDSLSLISKISEDQLKLGKLQNQLEQKTNHKQDASDKAQKSANINSTAADKLNDDPNNKKLARKAKNKAGDAKRDSRNARKGSESLDKLNQDIQDTKNRLEKNQAKLNEYIKNGNTNRKTTDTLFRF